MHYASCTHEKYPEFKGKIRAQTYLSGYVIRPWSDEKGKTGTELHVIAQNDVKVLK